MLGTTCVSVALLPGCYLQSRAGTGIVSSCVIECVITEFGSRGINKEEEICRKRCEIQDRSCMCGKMSSASHPNLILRLHLNVNKWMLMSCVCSTNSQQRQKKKMSWIFSREIGIDLLQMLSRQTSCQSHILLKSNITHNKNQDGIVSFGK